MKEHFSYDQRLGISIPNLEMEWAHNSEETQEAILFHWEKFEVPFLIELLNLKIRLIKSKHSFLMKITLKNHVI